MFTPHPVSQIHCTDLSVFIIPVSNLNSGCKKMKLTQCSEKSQVKKLICNPFRNL